MRVLWVLCWMSILGFSQSLDEQLSRLEEMNPSERVALMNQIKEELMEMNQEERLESIEKLRAKFHTDEHASSSDECESESIRHEASSSLQEHMQNHQDEHQALEHQDWQTHQQEHRENQERETNHLNGSSEEQPQRPSHQEGEIRHD